jgi:hypothetical protein
VTCGRDDPQLALYVEGDLPAAEAERLDRHLVGCESCRSFLRELRASQSALKALAEEPLPQTALSAVRERVLAETSGAAPGGRGRPAWLLATAAVVVVAAGLMALSRSRPLIPDRSIATRTVPSLPSATRSPQAPGRQPSTHDVATPVVPSPARPESTARAKRPVSPVPAAAQTLTPAEADQLARALVVVAEVESLADVQRDAEVMGGRAIPDREASSAFMRWTTNDPDVVIYWQLETNGGE